MDNTSTSDKPDASAATNDIHPEGKIDDANLKSQTVKESNHRPSFRGKLMNSDSLLAGNSITVDITTRTPNQLTKVVHNPPQANLRSLLRWSCNLPLLPPTPGISSWCTVQHMSIAEIQTSYGNLTEGAGLA